jgi:phospholipid/cholesterol/gamma-HCH transport system ATP-binding protein
MNAVTAEHVEYGVPGKTILSDVNLEINRGEIVAIMGMSGSGKTSLLKCMTGLVKPTSGKIAIDGTDIVPMRERELDSIRLKMGLVFQYAALFDSLTVFENVSFGLVYNKKLTRREIEEVVKQRLAEVGMSDTERLYPSQLSGGMQKRVGLARALATEPEILFYDEPTSGLDPVIARSIDELIVETRDRTGTTSVFVSHDIDSIFRIANRIAMLHEGRVIAQGTPEELRASTEPAVREFIGTA